MKYYKLKISLAEYEDRLNRTIFFKHNSDLDQLAFTILSIFNTLAYHLYMFRDDKKQYECDISLREALAHNFPDAGIDSYSITLDKLKTKNKKFKMIYDFGDNYEFIIEILETIELKEVFSIPRVIDGVGFGIVEDDKWALEEYLEGKELEYPLRFAKNGRYVNAKFEDFDLEECNRILKKEISKIRNAYYCNY